MRIYDIILKKRSGLELTREEIQFFIDGYVNGTVPDYQASALMMAVFFKGMTDEETAVLTDVMAHSGDMVDLSELGDNTVDKHSTGGVGDKTSLIVGPIVAAAGLKMAKMSGRGLGHTGGTVDKLEAIPGYKTSLAMEEFISLTQETGLSIIGQTGSLAPADKKLYALRDVTATVDSIPLITSSIMSKKLASGAKNIVLDVKCGSGAFMKTYEDARALGENMVRIGQKCNRNMAALITDMDRPLGNNIGNALEVIEAVEVVRGRKKDDLYEICIALAGTIIAVSNKVTVEEGKRIACDMVASGKAFEQMKKWIAAQGGDVRYIEDTSLLGEPEYKKQVLADRDGYIYSMNTEEIGNSAVILGAGRASKTDEIDHLAGIVLNLKTGDRVKKGDVLATLYASKENMLELAEKRFLSALEIAENAPEESKLIYETIIDKLDIDKSISGDVK